VEKELKEITQELNSKMSEFEKVTSRLEKALEGKATAEAIESMKASHDKLGTDIEKLNSEIERMGESLKEQRNARKSVGSYLKEAVTPDFLKKAMGKGNSNMVNLDLHPMSVLKATVDEHTNLTFGTTNANSVVLPFNESGVSKSPDRQAYLVDLFNTATINSPRVVWVERSGRTDGADTRSEGAIMGESDYTWIRRNLDVENISSYVKVTDEALTDWDMTLSEIRLELFGQLQRKLDDQLLAGNGATPNIAGVTHVCRTYDYAGLNTSVDAPNIFDAIAAAAAQVRFHLYNPNYVVLHPTDFAKMNLQKDDNGNYVLPPFISAGNMVIDGMRVVVNTGITAGQVLVGDFTKGTVYFRKGIDIRLWDQNDKDPIYGLKTITGDMRAVLKIAQPDYYAFVYDAISDITTAIGK
jgi:HK97 family phage major capsid protein